MGVTGGAEANPSKVLFSGSVAGAMSTLAGQPFDTLKVRIQTNPVAFPSLSASFLRTVREETVFALYKGASPALVSAVTENAVVFAANSLLQREALRLKQHYSKSKVKAELTLPELAAIGGLSGVFSATAICPAEIVKVRMQAQQSMAMQPVSANGSQKLAGKRIFRNSFECLRYTFQEGGMRGLFRGLPAQIARDVPFCTFFFGTYQAVCKGMCMWHGKASKDELSASSIIVAGGFAGIAGWTISLPMDVIKSTMQNSRAEPNRLPSTLRSVVAEIYAKNGIHGFFRGWAAVSLRAWPCNGALFFGYEFCSRAVSHW